MTHQHVCRIVKDARSRREPRWALYWDGAYCDNFASTQLARSAGLSLCLAGHGRSLVMINVEDASGRRLSSERLLHAAA